MKPYRLRDHARMFGDHRRNGAYAAALDRVVPPRGVVLDIGTGTGLLAMLACKAGAARVYAVESGAIISLARALAAHNGVEDRITFFEQSSLTLTLPEQVDVIVSDIRGVLPFAGTALVSQIDARQRFLRSGGTMVPGIDVIQGAVVSAPRIYGDLIEVWGRSDCGIDGAPVRAAAAQQVIAAGIGDLRVLSDVVEWTAIDYRALTSPSASGSLKWRMPAGSAHGFALWFDARLADEIVYDTGPGSGDDLYGVAFFPWPEPVVTASACTIEVDLRADLVGDSYVWTWRTRVAADGFRRSFDQSTFGGSPLSPVSLRAHVRQATIDGT
jgi:ribosomal protein L11 methyltransferase PrmA